MEKQTQRCRERVEVVSKIDIPAGRQADRQTGMEAREGGSKVGAGCRENALVLLIW